MKKFETFKNIGIFLWAICLFVIFYFILFFFKSHVVEMRQPLNKIKSMSTGIKQHCLPEDVMLKMG